MYDLYQNLTYFILVNGVHGAVTSSEQQNFLHCKLLLKYLAALRHTDFGLNATVGEKKNKSIKQEKGRPHTDHFSISRVTDAVKIYVA